MANIEDIKKLREMTSAGFGACKEALEEAKGDFKKAIQIIRQKGLAKSIKRAGRNASEGVLGVYLHGVGQKLVAVVEINCETDFVSRDKAFREFAHNVSMHIAAMNPLYVSRDDIPKDKLEEEKKVWREKFKKEGKPENIIDKIMEGKLKEYYKEVCLLEQPYFKDDSMTVGDLLAEALAKFGEKIVIKRFMIWEVGK